VQREMQRREQAKAAAEQKAAEKKFQESAKKNGQSGQAKKNAVVTKKKYSHDYPYSFNAVGEDQYIVQARAAEIDAKGTPIDRVVHSVKMSKEQLDMLNIGKMLAHEKPENRRPKLQEMFPKAQIDQSFIQQALVAYTKFMDQVDKKISPPVAQQSVA
jgi:hypothetical protein